MKRRFWSFSLCSLAVFIAATPGRAEDRFTQAWQSYSMGAGPHQPDEIFTRWIQSARLESLLRERGVKKPDVLLGPILEKSDDRLSKIKALFELGRIPKSFPEAKVREILEAHFAYRPVIATFLAGVETRDYGGMPWEARDLEFPDGDANLPRFYRAPLRSYVRAARKTHNARPLFILINGSFSAHPLWHDKLKWLLDEEFDSPHLLAFSGFLSADFLAAKPFQPPINTYRIAQDLYGRIRKFIRDEGLQKSQVGLIGSSGGARLVVDLRAVDADFTDVTGEPPLFQSGLSLSPALDLGTVFSTLDGQADRNPLDERRNLTEFITQVSKAKIGKQFQKGIRGIANWFPSLEDFLPYAKACVAENGSLCELEWRFYNEFISVFLHDVVQSLSPEVATDYFWDKSPHRCGPFFDGFSFLRHQSAGWAKASSTFAQYTDMRTRLIAGRSDLTIVYTKDDPVLHDAQYARTRKVPAAIEDLARVSESFSDKGVHTFFPEYGSHHAYFFDTRFLRNLLRATFEKFGIK